MFEKNPCPGCGQDLPPDAPRGPCPKCLMGPAPSSKPSPSPSATATHRPAPAPRGGEAPATPVDLAGFRRAVVELGLVSVEDFDRFAEGAGGDVARLAKALVQAGKLTPYQSGALTQGKARGLAIGPYLILNRLGQGGMGVVFRAGHRQTGRVVALKILLPSFGRDREAVLRFRREFELAAGLGHPNVVAAIEADEDRGVQYLTMEFVDGHDLDHLVREVGPLPVKMSIHCAIQAAQGLAAAHARGIIHRDVKPGNLILDGSGVVRVLDLGLARIIEAANPLGKASGSTLTQSGAYMGTVDFVAPEQADDSKRADHRSDIYALGCTLYFLLTGRPPFEGETLLKRLMAHQQRPAPSLYAAREDIPPALEAAYQSMMAKRPADRPRSMDVVIGLLEACRASADEAKHAGAGLRDFAATVMKRASPRKRDRSPDASVFVRPSERGGAGLQLGADLSLEDVMDYREETRPGEIPEDRLPPPMPRSAPPRRKRSRRRWKPTPLALGALAMVGLCAAGYTLKNRGESDGKPASPPRAEITAESAGQAASPGEPGWTSLFNGRDLAGWKGPVDDYEIQDGAVSPKPGKGGTIYYPKIYRDHVSRVEFRVAADGDSGLAIHYPGEGSPYLSGLCEIQIQDDSSPKYRKGDARTYHGSAYGLAAARRGYLKPIGEWNTQEVTVRGTTVQVELNGAVILDADIAQVRDGLYGPHPGRNRTAGYFGLFGRGAAPVAFRKVEIRPLEDPAADPDARIAASAPSAPRVLYVDDFSDPGKSNLQRDLHDPDASKEPVGADYGDGIYFMQERTPTQRKQWIRGPLVDFSCEAVGRVLRGKPNGRGAWGVVVYNNDRGYQARIDGQAQLSVHAYDPDHDGWYQRVGPISHPAIRPGNEFNTLKVNVRRRRMEILVNNILVCEPILADGDMTPAHVELSLWVDAPKARAEFDRVEFKELPPDNSAPARSLVGSWLHVGNQRLDIAAGGGLRLRPAQTSGSWSRSGTVTDLHVTAENGSTYLDRVELDGDGSHYRGANLLGGWQIAGARLPAGSEFNEIRMAMAPIPAGEFTMGTPPAQADSFLKQFPAASRDFFLDEQPAHRVRIARPFYLGVTEVTVAQFRRFVDNEGYKTDAERDGKGALTPGDRGGYVETPSLTWRDPGFENQGDHRPVVNVSWNDASAFCAWLSKLEGKAYRLPTEAEWEYACRAGTTTRYATGDDPLTLFGAANVADVNAREKYPNWPTYPFRDHAMYTQDVAHYRPNALGLYDMTGNVWEWCSDRYDATYYGQKVADDPKGPAEGAWRVIRGGGWNYDPPSGRPADRSAEAPGRRFNTVGFRVARDLSPGERFPAPSSAKAP